MFTPRPKVSIITACFNAADDLARTLDSMANVKYENIEHIVIDGASRDHTSQVVEMYKDQIACFVSEPDAGIADAWNKGLRRATGEYICFLNAGDIYHEDFINLHLKNIQNDNFQISYGITYLLDGKNIVQKVDAKFNEEQIKDGFGFLHTSVLTSKRVYELVGDFPLNYRIAIDADWLMRAYKMGVSFTSCQAKNYMALGGVSDKYKKNAQAEFLKILKHHGLIANASELTKLRLRYNILNILAGLNLFYYRRQFKTQWIFVLLKFLNVLHNALPTFFIRRMLHKTVGFDVHKTAAIHAGGEFFAFKRLSVGEGSVVNKNFRLDNRMGIVIGKHVSIAHDVSIYTLGHDIGCDNFCTKGAAVQIDDHAVIFAGARIMPGVTIGKGAVVYPGAVVMQDVPALCVVAGNPARQIKNRKNLLNYQLRYDYWFGH